MKSLAPVAFLLLTFLCGCSHSYYVAPGESTARGDTLTTAMLNERLLDRSAVVTDTSSRAYSATDVLLTPDSCTFFDGERSERLALPIGKVRSIEKVEHLGGAATGLGYGALTGLALGAGVGFSMSGDGHEGDMVWLARWALMGAGAAVGAATGLTIGAIAGSIFTYDILPAGQTDSGEN